MRWSSTLHTGTLTKDLGGRHGAERKLIPKSVFQLRNRSSFSEIKSSHCESLQNVTHCQTGEQRMIAGRIVRVGSPPIHRIAQLRHLISHFKLENMRNQFVAGVSHPSNVCLESTAEEVALEGCSGTFRNGKFVSNPLACIFHLRCIIVAEGHSVAWRCAAGKSQTLT